MPGLRILHLEDDDFDADLVQRAVARIDATSTWLPAPTVAAYQAAMEHARFDLIVSDNSVPGIDGLQALALAREKRPDVPFVFVSGNADPLWAERCIAAGAVDYVCKDQLWRLPSALRRVDAARETQRLATLTRARALLVDAVKQLSLARSVDAIVEIVRHAARELNQADGATVVLRDGELCHYVDEDAIGPLWKGQKFPLNACISGWAMLHGEPAVIPDIYADARIPHDAYRPTFVKSLVMVPIRAGHPIGAIGNYWALDREPTADEVALIQALADSTSLAFENVALVQGLEQRVQQRTAALEEANRELEAFTYSVSHDLRAPLRAVQGYSEMLAATVQPPLQGDAALFLQNVRQSAQRMGVLIDDLLSLSKVTRTELQQRPVQLGAMAREVLKVLQQSAPQRAVALQVDDTPVAQGDAGLLRLALENLLGNAWKFSARRPDARISFDASVNAAGETVYRVADNGAGFDMAQAAPMFEPFRRLHSEAEFSGTGIGLAIVQRVVQRHGGRIWAEGRRGEGASFFFVLPQQG
ncbi:MAG: ATP-binding protein [Rubrivivax sp.]